MKSAKLLFLFGPWVLVAFGVSLNPIAAAAVATVLVILGVTCLMFDDPEWEKFGILTLIGTLAGWVIFK